MRACVISSAERIRYCRAFEQQSPIFFHMHLKSKTVRDKIDRERRAGKDQGLASRPSVDLAIAYRRSRLPSISLYRMSILSARFTSAHDPCVGEIPCLRVILSSVSATQPAHSVPSLS